MEITENINGKEIVFEQGELIDRQGHSSEYAMYGYTKEGEEWKHTHNASGSYTFFGEFEEISEIEEF